MTRETNTVALVASTLGMATVVAITAVISATSSRADADSPKILDRISDARPAIGMTVERPMMPSFVEISDVDGTTVYRADPGNRETVIAQGVPHTADRIPLPIARSEAVLGLQVALATPRPKPEGTVTVGMRLPQPRPTAAVDLASVRQPLPKPTTADVALRQFEPASGGLLHLSAYAPEAVAN